MLLPDIGRLVSMQAYLHLIMSLSGLCSISHAHTRQAKNMEGFSCHITASITCASNLKFPDVGAEEEGYAPSKGYPRDAAPADGAVGGKAAIVAPVAAGVASGQPEDRARSSARQVRMHAATFWILLQTGALRQIDRQ